MHRNKPFATPGTLNVYGELGGSGFASSAVTAWTPMKLQLPAPTRAIR